MGPWQETRRRLHDGVTITTGPVLDLDDWISVRISAVDGSYYYSSQVPVSEAFAEIPFQLDRARECMRLIEQSRAEKREHA